MAQLVDGAAVTTLPDATTPLYHHPLPQIEAWLRQLGARQRGSHSCLWDLHQPNWSALLELEVEELKVTWSYDGRQSTRQFSYGLSRSDLEAAILAGP
jgi:hypothetical protein